jgi:chemotaxis family two-component system response regulator Rcp1
MNAAINNRLLLVEDDPDDVMLAQRVIKRSGMAIEMDVVHDGQDALDFLRRNGKYESAQRPALVLLDLNMPKVDGRQVLREIRKDPALKELPVIILSTSKADEDIQFCYRQAANSYVVKPENLKAYDDMMAKFTEFWLNTASLPG